MLSELRKLIQNANMDYDKVQLYPEGGIIFLEDLVSAEVGKLTPMEFLLQAEHDYDIGGQTALLNSLTNSKRAIQCQIDQWIQAFGFETSKTTKKKIEIINEIGYAPRILRKVSDARNLLEHEYRLPNIEIVEEALDLAWLFISSSLGAQIPSDIYAVNDDSEIKIKKDSNVISLFQSGLHFELDEKIKTISVIAFEANKGTGFKEKTTAQIVVKSTDPIYLLILRLMFAIHLNADYRIDKAFDVFWNTVHGTKQHSLK